MKATTLEREAAGLRAQMEDLQKELRKVRDDAGKAGARAAEIDRRSHDETSTLRKQLEEAREAVLKFQTAQEEAQALAAKRENDAVELRRRVEELQQELKKTREDGAAAAARLPELERRLQEEPAALRKQIEEAQEAARKLQAERDQLKCGVVAVDLRTGRLVGLLEFQSAVEEIFDVQILTGSRFPEIIGFQHDSILHTFVVPR